MFEKIKEKIEGIKKAKNGLSETFGPVSEIVTTIKEKGAVTTDHTYASLNIIKRKLEFNIFILGIISSLFFIVYYIFMIIQRINNVTDVIVYAALGVLLLVSIVFDILYFPGAQRKMNFIEIRHFKFIKKRKKYIFAFIKMSIKAFSLIFALVIILKDGGTKKDIISLAISFGLYVIQLLVYFVSYVAMSYISYLLIGIEEDMNNSGLYLISKKNRYKAEGVEAFSDDRENRYREQIRKEVEKMRPINEANENIKVAFGKYETFKKQARDLVNNPLKRKQVDKYLLDAENRYYEYHQAEEYSNPTYLLISLTKDVLNKKYELNVRSSLYHSLGYVIYYTDSIAKPDLKDEEEAFYEHVVEDIPELKDYANKLISMKK